MNDAREEFIGTAWVALGGLLTFMLPAWVLLTAVTIQLSPELSGFDMLLEGIADAPAERDSLSVWVRGGSRAALALVVIAPALGLVVSLSALGRRGALARVMRQRVALDDLVRDDAVLEGFELVARTTTASEAPPEASPQRVLAGPGRRLAAIALDTLALTVAYVVPLVAVLPLVDLTAPEVPTLAVAAGGLSLVLTSVLVVGQLVGLARRGQTLGKRLLGLRITRPDGSPADVGQVLGLRTFAWGLLLQIPVVGWLILPAADLVYLLVDDEHRTLHDRLADTVVLDVRAEGAATN